MSKGPLVLVGTTFRDADIRQWLHAIGEQRDAHGGSVLALVAREGLGLTRRQFDDVSEAIRQQWRAVGIDVVLVQDHSDAAQLLRELPAVKFEDYLLPRDRAVALWDRLLGNFSAEQARHSELLDTDRVILPSRSGSACDLTLWLSDGSADLVRWTSHDRVYRNPNKLRRVPLGFDSPWMAARAMSQSEILVEADPGDLQGSRRWRSVIAAPITVKAPGGPNLVVGALSGATTELLDDSSEIEWRTALADLVETWTDRLEDLVG